MKLRQTASAGGSPSYLASRLSSYASGVCSRHRTAKMWRRALLDWALVSVIVVVGVLVATLVQPRVQDIDLSDVNLQHPVLPNMVRLSLLGAICVVGVLLGLVIMIYPGFKSGKSFKVTLWAAHYYLLPAAEATAIVHILTEAVKLSVGRPRPFFATVCKAYVEGSQSICIGDASMVAEARKSFFSGHSSIAFVVATFLSLFFADRFRYGLSEPTTWSFLIALLPMFVAGFVSISRVIDYHHFPSDAVVGSLVGLGMGAASYFYRRRKVNEVRALLFDGVIDELTFTTKSTDEADVNV